MPPYYDSLLGKVIAWDENRESAIARALRALAETEVRGVPTTIPVAIDILRSEQFATGRYSSNFLAEVGSQLPALAES